LDGTVENVLLIHCFGTVVNKSALLLAVTLIDFLWTLFNYNVIEGQNKQRKGFLNAFIANLHSSLGHAIAQAVSRLLPTAAARVRAQVR
jgi:hypothetical protein